MVRLVDADKQLELVNRMTPIHGIGLEPVVAVETVRELIKGSQTVKAISVEWLESKRKEALHEGMRPDEIEAVEMVMWMWQKEQEAR